MVIISNLGNVPFLSKLKVFVERISEVMKWEIVLSISACAKSLESFGIIALGWRFSILILFSLNIIFANSPALSASFKLKGKIWIFNNGKSSNFPKTHYSAIVIVETFNVMSFSRKYL